MPGILIERGGYLREILHLLGAPEWDCQWLITGLECYDTCGWPGCGKWGQDTLLLSNRDFLRDVEARDMQFVWGVFSAIPAGRTREEIFAHPLPDFTDQNGRSLYLQEHLLPQHQDKTIALVESEKTAIICSAMMPQYLWLATGGKSGLTSERLSSLKGRKIIVFPDIDAFKDWQQKIFTFPHLDIRISRLLEDNTTPADRAAHIDLADWILKYLETNNN